MAKQTKKPVTDPVRAIATAERFDGGQIKIELVMQPDDAAKLADQLVRALLSERK